MSESTSKFPSIAKTILWSWIVLFILAVVTRFSLLALFLGALTGAMPFLILILWLGLSDRGRRIRGLFKLWHVRVLSGAIVFCYATYGHKWAADTINDLFKVDAKYFGITSTVLTVLFTPFGIIYRPGVASEIFDLFMIVVAWVIPFYLVYLLLAANVQDRGKKFGYTLISVFAGGAMFATGLFLSNHFKPMVKSFAVWADFNANHPCTDAWASEAQGVVFLDNGNVLAYFPNADGDHFKVVSCNYAKTF